MKIVLGKIHPCHCSSQIRNHFLGIFKAVVCLYGVGPGILLHWEEKEGGGTKYKES